MSVRVLVWGLIVAVLVLWWFDTWTAFLLAGAGNVLLTFIVGTITLRRAPCGSLGWLAGFAVLLAVPATAAHVWALLNPAHSLNGAALVAAHLPSLMVIMLAGFSAYRSSILVSSQVLLEAVMLASSGIAALWYLGLREAVERGDVSWMMLAVFCANALIAGLLFVTTVRRGQPAVLRLSGAALIILAGEVLRFLPRGDHDIGVLIPVILPVLVAWTVLLTHLPEMHEVNDCPDGVLVRSDTLRDVLVGGTAGIFIVTVVVSNLIEPRVGPLEWALIGTFIIAMWLRDLTQTRHSTLLLTGMRELALRDSLTGLHNRRALEVDIERRDRPADQAVSMLTLDIDQFKDVNDVIGHETGNKLLIRVATLLREAGAEVGAVAYRTGGDEFVVIVEQQSDIAEEFAHRIVTGVRQAGADLPGVAKLNVGASIGLRHLPPHASPGDLRHAMVQSGHAMRSAKRRGRGRVTVFDQQLEDAYRRQKLIEVHLREICDTHRPISPDRSPGRGVIGA